VGRRASQEASPDSAAAKAQLPHLDAILRGVATPSALGSLASTAVATPKAQRWSDDNGSDDDAATTASAASPSVGSAGHAAGSCRPCAFARSSSGCKFGAACNFCHLVSEHPESMRMRPCKGKRERLKRTMAAIEEQVAQNPGAFDKGGLNLPSFVDRNPQARARVLAHLAQVAAQAQTRAR